MTTNDAQGEEQVTDEDELETYRHYGKVEFDPQRRVTYSKDAIEELARAEIDPHPDDQ